eukprot:8867161-Alexandrium_andersonii.AAC.1
MVDHCPVGRSGRRSLRGMFVPTGSMPPITLCSGSSQQPCGCPAIAAALCPGCSVRWSPRRRARRRRLTGLTARVTTAQAMRPATKEPAR